MNTIKQQRRFDLEGLAIMEALRSVILNRECNHALIDNGTATGVRYQGLPTSDQEQAIRKGNVNSAQLVYSRAGEPDILMFMRHYKIHQSRSQPYKRTETAKILLLSERDSALVDEIANYVSGTCLQHGVGAAVERHMSEEQPYANSPQ